MKVKYKLIILLLVVSCFAFAPLFFNVNSADATTNKNLLYSDDFTGSEISSNWVNKGATLNTEYSSLSMVKLDVWGPSINLVNYTVMKNSVITIDAINIGSSNSWLGFAFGYNTVASRVYYAKGMVVMSSSTAAGTKLMTRNGNELSQSTMDSHETTSKTVFSGKNVNTTIKIQINNDGDITVSSGKVGEQLSEIITFHGAFNDCDGYIGFAGMGNASYDILSFKLEHNDEEVFYDDFKSSSLGHSSTGYSGKNWYVSYYYGEQNIFIAPSNNVVFNDTESLMYDYNVSEDANSENQLSLSCQIKLIDLPNNAYFGIGFGLPKTYKKVYEKSFIGFYKKDDSIYLAQFKYGKIVNVFDQLLLPIGEDTPYFNTEITLKYGGCAEVNILNNAYLIKDVDYNGYLAFGGSDNGVKVILDNFSVNKYTYFSSDSQDVSNNFNGLREEINEENDSIYYYYLNKYKYYVGTQIKQPFYEDGADKGYLNFTATTETSVLVPKEIYGESIIRFDFQVTNNTKTDSMKFERIGVCFGLTSAYFKPTSASFFCFQRNCEKRNDIYHDDSYTYGGNMTDCTEEGVVQPSMSCEYNIWEDTSTVYNVMLIVEDGTVRVYYKKSTEDDSYMNILRRKFEGANTYGYVGFFGYNGASFRLDNISVTNVNPYKSSSNGATVMNNTVSSIADSQNTLLILKVNATSLESLTFNIGGKNITLSENGVENEDGITVLENNFDKTLLNDSIFVRAELFGDTFSVGIRNKGSESQLYKTVVKGTLTEKSSGIIKLSVNGNGCSFDNVNAYSLDAKIEISPENYDKGYEDSLNPLKVKPPKSIQFDISGCSSNILYSPLQLLLILLVVGGFVMIRKERR